jgi:hypothetical protein
MTRTGAVLRALERIQSEAEAEAEACEARADLAAGRPSYTARRLCRGLAMLAAAGKGAS